MRSANGWTLLPHPKFLVQVAKLKVRVASARTADPTGYERGPDAKLLRAILTLIYEVIPTDPCAKPFRQGDTLGKGRKHWFRAKFGNGRYRLFFQFNSAAKIIIYAWVNDAESLRTYGSKTDAYVVFRSMLAGGNPPDAWEDLTKAVGARVKPGTVPNVGPKRKKGDGRKR